MEGRKLGDEDQAFVSHVESGSTPPRRLEQRSRGRRDHRRARSRRGPQHSAYRPGRSTSSSAYPSGRMARCGSSRSVLESGEPSDARKAQMLCVGCLMGQDCNPNWGVKLSFHGKPGHPPRAGMPTNQAGMKTLGWEAAIRRADRCTTAKYNVLVFSTRRRDRGSMDGSHGVRWVEIVGIS